MEVGQDDTPDHETNSQSKTRQQFQVDAHHILRQCKKVNPRLFKDFQITPSSCSFVYENGEVRKEFLYSYVENYPGEAFLTTWDLSPSVLTSHEEVKPVTGSFISTFSHLAKDLEVHLPDELSVTSEQGGSNISESDAASSGVASGASNDNASIYSSSAFDDVLRAIEGDLKIVNKTFGLVDGEPSGSYSFQQGLHEVTVVLRLAVKENLPSTVFPMWGINDKPVQIKLFLSGPVYRQGPPPKVVIVQEHNDNPTSVLHQLNRILDTFLNAEWESKDATQQGLVARTLKYIQKWLGRATEAEPVESLLTDVLAYAKERLATISDYCVVCDTRQPATSRNMLKPTVCEQPLCIFSLETMDFAQTPLVNALREASVTNLLVELARAACAYSLQDIYKWPLKPFPKVVDPANPGELAFSPRQPSYHSTLHSYDKLTATLEDIPALPNLQSHDADLLQDTSKHLQTKMKANNRLAFPLLKWIISSNRSHIVLLPEAFRIPSLNTKYQFILHSAPPQRESDFNTFKSVYGSSFAFHGSPFHNWHSIIRQGLMVCSGTQLETHGSKFGDGIYLCQQFEKAMQYTRQPTAWTGNFTLCLALCEVVNSPALVKHYLPRGESVWVMENPEHVMTRFLIAYASGKDSHQRFNTRQIAKEITHALTFSP